MFVVVEALGARAVGARVKSVGADVAGGRRAARRAQLRRHTLRQGQNCTTTSNAINYIIKRNSFIVTRHKCTC